MKNVKGLFFDVGGTVFDWKNTVREKIHELADAKGHTIDSEAFANDWRSIEKPEWDVIHRQVKKSRLREKMLLLLRRGKISNNKFEFSIFCCILQGESISPGLPFCIFMKFTIYVIGVDQPWVAFMARDVRV
jgi:hypothetical protein